MLRTSDFAGKVRLHLIELRAASLLQELTSYIGQQRGSVPYRWEPTWRPVSLTCLHLAKWKANVAEEDDALSTSSRAYRDAIDLARMREALGSECVGEGMSPVEVQLVTSLLGCLEEIVEIFGLERLGPAPVTTELEFDGDTTKATADLTASAADRIASIARSLMVPTETTTNRASA